MTSVEVDGDDLSPPAAAHSRTLGESASSDRPAFAIETEGLAKSFGDTVAVDGVDLRIPRGSVYRLLGPNGAGKTTTIRILATLLRPDAGTATVLGHDVVRDAADVRARVSLTGQYASVDEDLTGHENLVLMGRLLGFSWRGARRRADELLSAFGLEDAATRQVRTYSGGMRRRLDIAASLVVTPDVLFLDEPTTGLDPRSRNRVWAIIRAIAAEGTTVLLTTQYLDEADRLADRLAVIDDGQVIAEGTSQELKAAVGTSTLHVRLRDPGRQAEAEALVQDVTRGAVEHGPDRGTLAVSIPHDEEATSVLTALSAVDVEVTEFALGQASLDEVFLALTGQPTDDTTEEVTT
ncbi:ATP-binding cassette domain-containing protein [Halomarina ordinaria]|uniref:ATP-binding cassette domain-containing protein n=1 Tax=Halomarina ordinaria TaxID=3033939 RepID=A0ABD5UGD0_9EURY|nr:ATP-binding cassette domain-containing protein [Halomarina sp. PSRA2]